MKQAIGIVGSSSAGLHDPVAHSAPLSVSHSCLSIAGRAPLASNPSGIIRSYQQGSPQMDLALFDFDGTITDRETMPSFMAAAVRPARLVAGKIVLLPLIVGYKLGVVPGTVIRAAICWFGFRGVPVAEIESRAAGFARSVLPGTVRPEALERIAWHKARGDRIVVVSGGLDLYLKHWTEAHGLDLMCSSLEERSGVLTGLYLGRQCVRAEKVRRVQALLAVNQFGKVFAYGDTPEDHALLSIADEAYFRWARWTRA